MGISELKEMLIEHKTCITDKNKELMGKCTNGKLDTKENMSILLSYYVLEDFDILYKVLLNCDVEMIKSKEQNFYNIDIPKRKFMPYEIIGKESEEVCLSDSLGRVVFENIIPYPPGVPILVSGEIIEQEHIKYIENYINEGTNIIGLNNHYIKVIKSDDKV